MPQFLGRAQIRYPRVAMLVAFIMLIVVLIKTPVSTAHSGTSAQTMMHLVKPGDTWLALSLRFGVDEAALRTANTYPNWQRQPTIGNTITIPGQSAAERHGKLITSPDGGLMGLAVQYHKSPWELALANKVASPYRPLLYRTILVPDAQSMISQMPVGVDKLELSTDVAQPGEALAIALSGTNVDSFQVDLGGQPIALITAGDHAIGVFGTGAFFDPGEYDLSITAPGIPAWSQPWLFGPGEWNYEEITLTGSAAAIDAESIRQERERLVHLWAERIEQPLWDSPFQLPISDYLSISSTYGTRRSYNGGPYSSYHEGLDFSAYGGTPVNAPAAGTVVLAERLYVRGGAVIINHGLGVFTGVYHQDEVLVEAGQDVVLGQIVGKVGSTGLSTGNHLHWDLLVDGTWVDPQAWLSSGIADWILDHWPPNAEETPQTQ